MDTFAAFIHLLLTFLSSVWAFFPLLIIDESHEEVRFQENPLLLSPPAHPIRAKSINNNADLTTDSLPGDMEALNLLTMPRQPSLLPLVPAAEHNLVTCVSRTLKILCYTVIVGFTGSFVVQIGAEILVAEDRPLEEKLLMAFAMCALIVPYTFLFYWMLYDF